MDDNNLNENPELELEAEVKESSAAGCGTFILALVLAAGGIFVLKLVLNAFNIFFDDNNFTLIIGPIIIAVFVYLISRMKRKSDDENEITKE